MGDTPIDLKRLGFTLKHKGRGSWAVIEHGKEWPWTYKSRADAVSMIREHLALHEMAPRRHAGRGPRLRRPAATGQ